MAKNSLLILSLLVSFGCTNKSAPKEFTPSASAEGQIKKFNYSLSELNSASNYLTKLSLHRAESKKSPLLKCDPSDKDINMWTMQIKSLIDEQEADAVKPYDENDNSYLSFCGSRLHLFLLSLSR